MNRLGVRLTLAFVFVTVVAVGTVAVLANWSATSAFTSYVTRQNEFVQSGRLEELAAYYTRTGGWANVADFFAALNTGSGGRNRATLLLADLAGQIIYDERAARVGEVLTTEERARGLAVQTLEGVVGYVVFNAVEGGALTPTQQTFLNQLQLTFVVAAGIAGVLGVILGLGFSRSLSAPLAALAATAQAFAARNWQQRAPEVGTDEVAAVGRAFNAMATSLQNAETLRRNLMADIAHELRTPLTVMQGNLRALLDGVYPLELKEIATLYDETRLVNRLVDDLRELALADAGQLSLTPQSLNAHALLTQAQLGFSAAAEAQGVTLRVNVDAILPSVLADPDRAAQVLRNLVANALRYSTAAEVLLSAQAADKAVLFRVQDSGVGIAPEDVPYVFERFYRADKSRARTSGGSGLGLAISKAWVEAMGGRIGVRSQEGQGTEFWFTLPCG